MDTDLFIKAFGAFFAVMNPFINLPIFLAITSDMSVKQQRVLAGRVALYSVLMGAVILFSGQAIINFFGVSIADFRIAGGAVLAGIAWSMLNGSEATSHHGTHSERENTKDLSTLAFYPLTFPMVVGPGTIATIIVFTSSSKGLESSLILGGVLVFILLLLFLVLFFASSIGKLLSETLRSIMTRLMGMILLAISADMIVAGIKTALPGLA